MATKVTPGKLNVSVSETVTVNGVEHTYSNSRTVSGINSVTHRIVRTDAAGNELALLNFHASESGAGQFIDGQAKYIRITNLDDTNTARLILKSTNKLLTVHLAAGETVVVNNAKVDGKEDTVVGTIAYTDVDSISVIGRNAADDSNAAIDIEYFVAAVQS